jgi:signal peptidase I
MNKHLPLLLFIGLAWGQNKVNVNNLVQYGDLYFKKDDDKPFNGVVFDLSRKTGKKILEYRMIDGKKNGYYKSWDSNGNILVDGTFFNNDSSGIWIFSKKDGSKIKLEYKNNIKNGNFISYYSNGNKEFEVEYKNNIKNGNFISYYSNGNKKFKGLYKGGMKISEWRYFDKNGKLVSSLQMGKKFIKKLDTGSMENTLKIGEAIKLKNPNFDDMRQKIIVFKYPRDTIIHFVKRVVGIGGDTIAIKERKLFVNGLRVPYPKKGNIHYSEPMPKKFRQAGIFLSSEKNINRDNIESIYIPKRGDVFKINEKTNWKYLLPLILMEGNTASLKTNDKILEFTLQDPDEIYRRNAMKSVYNEYWYSDNQNGKLITPWNYFLFENEHFRYFKYLMINGQPASLLKEYRIKQNYYWAMGDNRDDSLDSRYWGFISQDQIIGVKDKKIPEYWGEVLDNN